MSSGFARCLVIFVIHFIRKDKRGEEMIDPIILQFYRMKK